MAAGLTLDAGALVAAEKGDRAFWALWQRAAQLRSRVTVPAVVLAQVWRGNSPVIARVLAGCEIEPLDEPAAKRVGEALAAARRSDIVDGTVVAGAVARRDTIVTSDPDDIGHLVGAARSDISVIAL